MKHKIFVAIILTLGLTAPTFAQDKTADVDKIFAWTKPNEPGCSVAVSQNGKLVVNKAYGSADLEREVHHSVGYKKKRTRTTSLSGKIGRFTDGRREIIIRRVTVATRKLHPASDCFRATGYSITPMPLRVDAEGRRWSSFVATKGEERLKIYERIEDNAGREWTDVSAWYWSVWGQERGEWWAWTIAERD